MKEQRKDRGPQYLFVIDTEELLPAPRTEFVCRFLSETKAGEHLQAHRMWFWHFATREAAKLRQLEKIAAGAGLPGSRLEERKVESRKILSERGVHGFLLIRPDGSLELLTPA